MACGDQLVVVHFRFRRFDLLWLKTKIYNKNLTQIILFKTFKLN
jgi:hypothetical protein